MTRAPRSVHPEDVQRLAPCVLLAHVDLALEAEERRDRRGRHAVLPGAGLRDHAGLPMRAARSPWPSVLLILWAPV